MAHEEIVLKSVAPLRVAELTATAASYAGHHIGPVIGPLYARLMGALAERGHQPVGPAVAEYEALPDGQVLVRAGVGVGPEVEAFGDVGVRDLDGWDEAATVVHHGPMSEVMPSMEALVGWIDEHGYEQLAWAREVYLDYSPDDEANGVTELQVPVHQR